MSNIDMRVPFIDLHQDIADNCLILTGKDFLVENSLHQGKNTVGLPVNNQVDLPRLKRSGAKLAIVAACPFSVEKGEIRLVENPVKEVFRQVDFYQEILKKTDDIRVVKNWKDYQQAMVDQKIGWIFHVEGADGIDADNLDQLFTLGIRSIGLTHNDINEFAGGAKSEGELTEKGIELIRQAQSLGMIVDLAHLNHISFKQVISFLKPPFMFSHGGIVVDKNHPRNLTDDQVLAIAKKGGIFGISFAPNLMSNNSIDTVVAIFQHLKKLVGTETIAIGSDFDGIISQELVEKLEDVTGLEYLAKILKEKGFSDREIENIFYKNVENRLLCFL